MCVCVCVYIYIYLAAQCEKKGYANETNTPARSLDKKGVAESFARAREKSTKQELARAREAQWQNSGRGKVDQKIMRKGVCIGGY